MEIGGGCPDKGRGGPASRCTGRKERRGRWNNEERNAQQEEDKTVRILPKDGQGVYSALAE
jgi:hypothetical protein